MELNLTDMMILFCLLSINKVNRKEKGDTMYKFIYLNKANKKVCQSYFHRYETCMEMEESYKKQYEGGHAIISYISR